MQVIPTAVLGFLGLLLPLTETIKKYSQIKGGWGPPVWDLGVGIRESEIIISLCNEVVLVSLG